MMMHKFSLLKSDYKVYDGIWEELNKNSQEKICRLLAELAVKLINENLLYEKGGENEK